MAPKSASSGSKKKSSATSDEIKQPKFKLPTEYIIRPLPANSNSKESGTITVNSKVLSALEISSGSFCIISKFGENGIAAIANPSKNENHPANVILVSDTLRSVSNIILGDRVEIQKLTQQPAYAKSITVGPFEEGLANEKVKLVEKLLDDCGLIMPGMRFNEIATDNNEKLHFVVTDVDDDDLPDIGKLSLNADESEILEFMSKPVLFKKGSTKLKFTADKNVSKKYSLPQSLSYDAVGGLKCEIDLLKKAIDLPLHRPEIFADFGISPPKGILMHGPPGTGKTMLLRCVANASNAHVLSIDGPSIVSKYLGETESKLREIFNEAKKYQPAIIFIDEIDSIAPNRANDDSGEVESRVVATLLTLMDGTSSSGRIAVIAATNRPNAVDPALRRPGRFDQEIEIGIPDVDARFDILKKQFEKISTDKHTLSEGDIKSIASKTHGYVGADLTALCRESVMKTIQKALTENSTTDMTELKVGITDVESAMLEIRPSAMREIFLEMPKVYWSDIGGQEDLKRKMKEMIQLPLEAADTFAALGIKAPKGILLYGPPGCSKTLTAKALATESGVNFLAVKGPEIFNKYVGESERAIREIFRKARAASPSIIFFDEIDALSPDRDGSSTSAANHVLTSLLNEIDGVEELNGVVIVAATNRPDEIDSALLRPGRLDRHVYVSPPDFNARLQILKKCTKNFDLDNTDELLNDLATRTEGCSGAEVVLLCQEAGLSAIMDDIHTKKVDANHFEVALQGISKCITPEMLEYYQEFASRSGIAS